METIKCELCGKEIPQSEAVEINGYGYVCKDCYDNECVKCSRCGNIIPYDNAHCTRYGTLCPDCYEDLFG